MGAGMGEIYLRSILGACRARLDVQHDRRRKPILEDRCGGSEGGHQPVLDSTAPVGSLTHRVLVTAR